jgi:hypothetical protein
VTPRQALVAIAIIATTCTGPGTDPSDPERPTSPAGADCPAFVLERHGGRCVDALRVAESSYRVRCIAVPEVLIDVPLVARWGRRTVHAIAAVPSAHAVAVTAGDERCGTHALALRTDLSVGTQDAIIEEVEAAGSLPPALEK